MWSPHPFLLHCPSQSEACCMSLRQTASIAEPQPLLSHPQLCDTKRTHNSWQNNHARTTLCLQNARFHGCILVRRSSPGLKLCHSGRYRHEPQIFWPKRYMPGQASCLKGPAGAAQATVHRLQDIGAGERENQHRGCGLSRRPSSAPRWQCCSRPRPGPAWAARMTSCTADTPHDPAKRDAARASATSARCCLQHYVKQASQDCGL